MTMKAPLNVDERLVKSGKANLQRGWETVGGHLYLTTKRLRFEPHTFNAQTQPLEVAVGEIHSVDLGWTKLLGLLPLFPNTISVRTTGRQEFNFVVFGRKVWATAIASGY